MQLCYQNVTAIFHHQFQSLNLLLIYFFFNYYCITTYFSSLPLSLHQPMQSRATKQLLFNKWVIQLKNKLYLLHEEKKPNNGKMDLLGEIIVLILGLKIIKIWFFALNIAQTGYLHLNFA